MIYVQSCGVNRRLKILKFSRTFTCTVIPLGPVLLLLQNARATHMEHH